VRGHVVDEQEEEVERRYIKMVADWERQGSEGEKPKRPEVQHVNT